MDTNAITVVYKWTAKPGQLDVLKGLNCELGQGFTFSRPMRASQVIYMLKE